MPKICSILKGKLQSLGIEVKEWKAPSKQIPGSFPHGVWSFSRPDCLMLGIASEKEMRTWVK